MASIKLDKDCIAGRHLGIIAGICLRYWKMLPPHAHGHLDPDTLIADTVAVVTQKAQRHYSRRRAMESTFVHMVAESHCRNVLVYYQLKKRSAVAVLQLEHMGVGGDLSSAYDLRKLCCNGENISRESCQAVERMMETASEGLRSALERFLVVRRFSVLEGFVEELRALAKRHHVTRRDMELVLRAV